MLGLAVLFLFSISRRRLMFDFAKKIAPLAGITAAILSLSTNPPPFGLTVGILQLAALVCLAVHIVGAYLDKPKA